MERIKIDKDLCMGCLSCVLACMAEHNDDKRIDHLNLQDLSNDGRNRIAIDSKGKPIPIFCRHCDEPECVTACMSGAMTKDEITGIVSYDSKKCASCYMCIMSCPFGVLKPDETNQKVILKCDMCNGKDIPACVANCPTGAIYIDGGDKM